MALIQDIAECLVRRDAIALERESPGILVFSASLQLLYMNRAAQELTKRLHQSDVGNHEKGLPPYEVMSLCKDLVTLFRTRVHPKDWEQMQLTRVAGVAKCPVLLRGVRIPSHASPQQGCLLILMEALHDQQEPTGAPLLAGYHLTKREETVVTYLLQGLTNKQIADRLALSEYTVKDNLKRIMLKTKTTTRTGVLALFLPPNATRKDNAASSEPKSEGFETATAYAAATGA